MLGSLAFEQLGHEKVMFVKIRQRLLETNWNDRKFDGGYEYVVDVRSKIRE